ncbi:Sorting nexin mvp1, partial [Choanephora cucurbitarum]
MQDYDSNGYGGLSYNNPFKPDANSSSLSSSSPVLFADDPWKASNKVNPLLADFDDHDVNTDTLTQKDNPEINSELKASNVLLGVNVPDAYIDVYAQCSPRQESVSLEKVLTVIGLSGLTNEVQEKIMSLIIAPDMKYVTRNEFNACLALVACGQKNMDVSLETVLRHKNDLPIPSIPNIDEIRRAKLHKDNLSSNSTQHNQSIEEQQYHVIHQEEQNTMNQWLSDLDHVSVTLALEKEGFLFKHVNYELESQKLKSKVLRRFSDFWWLWEVLLKRYPFRMIPGLPPKKLGGRTSVFEERRRKGLSRFINTVVQHPTIGCDEVVVAFLSHSSEINSWKRTYNPSLDEEFVRKAHPIGRINRLIPMDLDDRIARMKRRLAVSIQNYERMCFIMNQTSRLKAALGTDCIRYSVTLNSASEVNKDCWVPDCQGCSQMAYGYENISKSLQQAGALFA